MSIYENHGTAIATDLNYVLCRTLANTNILRCRERRSTQENTTQNTNRLGSQHSSCGVCAQVQGYTKQPAKARHALNKIIGND